MTKEEAVSRAEYEIHSLGSGRICGTERRGYSTPQGKSPLEIVVDASGGFIPLWAENVALRWRFGERSFLFVPDADSLKAEIRTLFAEALLKWGNAAPVKFTEDADVWDFEFVMRSSDECSPAGCVLASAFFPDTGRHELVLYPKLFGQSKDEQIDTLVHELGHVFGLRHFFAQISENGWPSEIFGVHDKFSIMNYGVLSKLTQADKDDLARLYQLARSGSLVQINGTPIRLVKPFNSLAAPDSPSLAVSQFNVKLRS